MGVSLMTRSHRHVALQLPESFLGVFRGSWHVWAVGCEGVQPGLAEVIREPWMGRKDAPLPGFAEPLDAVPAVINDVCNRPHRDFRRYNGNLPVVCRSKRLAVLLSWAWFIQLSCSFKRCVFYRI